MPRFRAESIEEELLLGDFQLDCSEIKLTQQTEDNPIQLKGPGLISIGSDGYFEFKILDAQISDPYGMRRRIHVETGEFYPTNLLFFLEAKDYQGRSWECAEVYPHVDELPPGPFLAYGMIRHLVANAPCLPETYTFEKASATIVFYDAFDFPATDSGKAETVVDGETVSSRVIPSATFSASDHQFHLELREKTNVLTVTCPGEKYTHWLERRAIESFEFAVGFKLRPMSIRTQAGNKEVLRWLPPEQRQDLGEVKPPVNVSIFAMDPNEFAKRLVGAYFSYIVGFTESRVHPISECVIAVNRSVQSSYDAHALSVSTAVEGVLNYAYEYLDPLPPQEESKLKAAKLILNDSEIDPAIKNRIDSALSAWSTRSARSKLNHLSDLGIVEKDNVKAWMSLRNYWVHRKPPENWDFVKTMKTVEKVTVLFYHLIFHAIGYQGNYVDYSTKGWPNAYYRKKE